MNNWIGNRLHLPQNMGGQENRLPLRQFSDIETKPLIWLGSSPALDPSMIKTSEKILRYHLFTHYLRLMEAVFSLIPFLMTSWL